MERPQSIGRLKIFKFKKKVRFIVYNLCYDSQGIMKQISTAESAALRGKNEKPGGLL